MNKLSIITHSMLITMSLVGGAYADNDSAGSVSLNRWTGVYAGGDAGFILNKVQLRSQQLGFTNSNEQCNSSSSFSTFFPGIQVGYLYQFLNSFVVGWETHVSFNTHQKDILSCRCSHNFEVVDRFSFKNQMQVSIKGRGGRALLWNKALLLPYLTAGASFASTGLTYQNEGGDYYSKNTTQAGWLVGAGLEWSLGKNWSLRAEYSYVDYGNTVKLKIPRVYGLSDPNGNARVELNTHNILIAINYWM